MFSLGCAPCSSRAWDSGLSLIRARLSLEKIRAASVLSYLIACPRGECGRGFLHPSRSLTHSEASLVFPLVSLSFSRHEVRSIWFLNSSETLVSSCERTRCPRGRRASRTSAVRRGEREAGLDVCKAVHLPPSDARLFAFLLPSFCSCWLNLIVGSCPVSLI